MLRNVVCSAVHCSAILYMAWHGCVVQCLTLFCWSPGSQKLTRYTKRQIKVLLHTARSAQAAAIATTN